MNTKLSAMKTGSAIICFLTAAVLAIASSNPGGISDDQKSKDDPCHRCFFAGKAYTAGSRTCQVDQKIHACNVDGTWGIPTVGITDCTPDKEKDKE